jgi:acetyltransferase-like isoleucine patch superfamily enzyme
MWVKVVLKRIFTNVFIKCLDGCGMYEPPCQRIKAFFINKIMDGNIHQSSVILPKVSIKNYKNLELGKYSYISHGVTIDNYDKVIIGKCVTISPEVYISTGDHSTDDLTPKHGEIIIGNGVFIGARAVILKGISIGDHSIIGAGAVVTKNIPPKSIAVGNPAKVIKERSTISKVWTILGVKEFE